MPSRSTLHSADRNPTPDAVHCPPERDKSNVCPSTARSAPCFGSIDSGCCCHADLFKARFSVIDSHIPMLHKRLKFKKKTLLFLKKHSYIVI